MNNGQREQRFLRYIRDSIQLIECYTEGSNETFLRQPMVQDAVLRRLETLAEATSKLSSELKGRHAEIPWAEVYGFRNVAAHAYVGLDVSRVSRVCPTDSTKVDATTASARTRHYQEQWP